MFQVWKKSEITGKTYPSRQKIHLGFEKYGNTFNFDDEATLKRLDIANFYCPKMLNYTLAGSFNSALYMYVDLKFMKCTGTGCQSLTAMNTALEGSKVSFNFVNAYFDFKSPVKRFLDDQFFWDLLPGFRKKTDVFIKKNEGDANDNLI